VAKITVEMEVGNESIEDAITSLKALEAAQQRIDDLCEDMSFLSKAVATNNSEVKKLRASVQELLEQVAGGSV